MLNRKKCVNCNKKIKTSFDFCPHCGTRNIAFEDYGMLGLEDNQNKHQPLAVPQKQTMLDAIIGKIMESTMNAIEKEMQKDLKEMTKNAPKQNFQLMINGQKVDPATLGIVEKKQIQPVKTVSKLLNDQQRKKLNSLPEKEPKTSVRRLSNKVLYELEIPGVDSIDDVSINQLENSIEIKALSLKKAYKKLIPVSLPIKHYFLEKGKLTLELESN
jgi:HSP20 family molecular chaperone IbpA/RNA polymerase subunit RPABC4/transcription elongation factor Spt4